MTDASSAITWSAALIAGVAGSAHCFAMCGGLAGALSMRARAAAGGSANALRDAWLYHLGRLGGYTLAGAIVGLLGNTIQSSLDLPRLGAALRFAGGVLVMLVAVRVLFSWNALAWIERLGAHFWRSMNPLVRLAASGGSASRSLLLGLLWGWLPCGLVYSMLLFSALSGDALRGGAIMLTFGVGTLPSMLASSLLASRLNVWLKHHAARRVSGALLFVFGAWLAWAAIPSPPHHGDHSQHGIAAAAAGSAIEGEWT